MPVNFQCPNCQQMLSAGEECGGMQMQCPYCGAGVIAPTTGSMGGFPPGGNSVSCPYCGQAIIVPPELAGSQVQCPRCGNGLVAPAVPATVSNGYSLADALLPNGTMSYGMYEEMQQPAISPVEQFRDTINHQWMLMIGVFAFVAVIAGICFFHEPRPNDNGPLWKSFGDKNSNIEYLCFEDPQSVQERKHKPWRKKYYYWLICSETSADMQVTIRYKNKDGIQQEQNETLNEIPEIITSVKGAVTIQVYGGTIMKQKPKNVKTTKYGLAIMEEIVKELRENLRQWLNY